MAKQELLATIWDRYQAVSREVKSRILDEFTAVAGHHRKLGIRPLALPLPPLHNDALSLPLSQAGPSVRETAFAWPATERFLIELRPPLAEGEHHRELELAGGRRSVEVFRQ